MNDNFKFINNLIKYKLLYLYVNIIIHFMKSATRFNDWRNKPHEISPVAPRKKEIAMPDDVEQKEVAATNSMTTGWYVANRTAYIFDVSFKEKRPAWQAVRLSLNRDCQWRNSRRTASSAIDGNLWNVDLLLLLLPPCLASIRITYFRIENFNSRNRQNARDEFSPIVFCPRDPFDPRIFKFLERDSQQPRA